MSDENQNEVQGPDELTLLKERADQMGIAYHPAIGVIKLKEKVDAELNGTGAGEQDSKVDVTDVSEDTEKAEFERAWKAQQSKQKETNKKPLTAIEKQQMLNTRLRKEAHKLIRVRITCMNPNKKNWTGEIMSVSNRVIGTVKKFIPFSLEEGYHIPTVLYKMLKERQYQHFSQVKGPHGTKAVAKTLPEFAIEILDPLTLKELDDLKQRQIANHSID